MSRCKSTDQFKQDAVAKITEIGDPLKEVSKRPVSAYRCPLRGSGSARSESLRRTECCCKSGSNAGGTWDTKNSKTFGAIRPPPEASQTPPCPRSPLSSEELWQVQRFLDAAV